MILLSLFRKLFLPLVVLILLAYSSSLAGMRVGDELLIRDKIFIAEQFYHLAKITNPFDTSLDQRLLATRIIAEERKSESEETTFPENEGRLAALNVRSNVLGTTVVVPVLMYHYIRINPDPNDRVGFNLSVTPANFASQMDYLDTHGYHTISLDELGAALFNSVSLPSHPIVLTFDDSYSDCFWQAYPVLRSHGFKGVNFVITSLVGAPNYLTWGQIVEMKNSGVFTFGGHTVHHLALTYLSSDKVIYEVSESKNALQTHLGSNVNWFAYPYGNVDYRVVSIVRQTGYVGAFGTNNGTYQSTDYLYTLPRVRIGGGDSVQSFAAKLPWK